MAFTVVSWVLPKKEETNEIAYNERLQFISGAKTELKRLYVLKEIWEVNKFDDQKNYSYLDFLTNQITMLKNEIEINEQLDAKEVEHIKDICRRYWRHFLHFGL